MSKTLTLSVSLALALGFSGVSRAGGHHGGNAGCETCGLASPQSSPQSVVAASPQCETCAPAKKHCFSGMKMPKMHFPKCTTTYEWVLKKKKVWSHGGGCGGSGCGNTGCNDCGGAGAVYPTSQVAPSSQAYAAPQYAAPAVAPAGQTTYYRGTGDMKRALAADEVPPAPTIATGGSSLLPLSPSGN